jgi:hypothetical protein
MKVKVTYTLIPGIGFRQPSRQAQPERAASRFQHPAVTEQVTLKYSFIYFHTEENIRRKVGPEQNSYMKFFLSNSK